MLLTPFILRIITPTQQIEQKVTTVEVTSPTGSFLVTYQHAPLISLIAQQGTLTYQDVSHAKETIVAPQGGFFIIAADGQVSAILEG